MSIGGRWKGSPALVVALPLSVLFEKNGSPAVWVFDQQSGSATLKPVTVARYEADTVIIASGLAKGDIVVTAGINTLREGQKVRLADAAAGGSDRPMKNFNLSRWALEHKSLVVYFMLVIALAGMLRISQARPRGGPALHHQDHGGEDAVARRHHARDRKAGHRPYREEARGAAESRLSERATRKPGESVVFVNLKDSTRASDVPDLWYQARKKVGDIKQTLPEGVQGPFFNDEFGDTYSLIFRAHLGWFWTARAARLCRARARRTARRA